jgi:hypothetical protein
MKRRLPRKLRDRRTGKSPYQKYGKRPYVYSGDIRETLRQTQELNAANVPHDKRSNVQ